MEQEEILGKTIKSIVALTSRSLFLQLISAVALIFLGALLTHEEVGVYIVIVAITRIFTFFTDLGLGAALVQKSTDLDKNDLNTAFFVQTVLVGAVVIIGLLATPFVVKFSHLSGASVFLYQVLVFTLFISSLKMIPSILLERKLAFDKQIVPQIVESLVFNSLLIFFALRHFGVASYSWSILISALVGLPIYYLISPWLPTFTFSFDSAKKLVRYGVPFQSKSVLAIIKDDLLTFFLSAVVGPGGVGYWGFAQKFAYYPFRFIVDSVTKVTFPAYSRIQHEREILRTGLEKSLLAVSILVFPILTLMALLAKNLILLIPKYHQWLPALPSFYFLCGAAILSALSNIMINALDATGRVKTTLGLMIFWIILTWGSVLILLPKFGFTAIAMANFLVASTIVVTIYLVKQTVKFNFLANIYQPAVATVAMAVGTFILIKNLPNNFLTIGLISVVAAIIYLGAMLVLGKKALINDLRIVIKALRHD